MSEATAGGSAGPGWVFWTAAFVCLAGPFVFGTGEDMRAQVRILAGILSVPFALASAFLALSTRKPRCGGAALWAAAILWLGAVFFLMVPIRGWAMNHDMQIDSRLIDIQGLVSGLASLAFLAVAVRAVGRRDGWELPWGVRATHSESLLVLAVYLARGAMMAWGSDLLSVGTGIFALAWELTLAHYVGLIAASLMAFSVGARYVLAGVETRRPTSGCS